MNIIDIADYQKSIPVVSVENESAPLPGKLTEEEIDQVNELLDYFRDIEDSHSAFKILSSVANILSQELLSPAPDAFMVPLNDNHSL